MQIVINPGQVKGSIYISPSKSMSQRVLLASLMTPGSYTINNIGKSEDELAVLNIVQQLGASVKYITGRSIQIKSEGIKNGQATVNCGESGLAARLMIPILATQNAKYTVTGNGSLPRRPMTPICEALEKAGVFVESQGGYMPIQLQGPIDTSKTIELDGSLSSQYVSGILLAMCSTSKQPVSIIVHNLQSRPYIDMTLDVLETFGYAVTHKNYEEFCINPAEKKSVVENITIESDWSSAAFMMVAAAMNGDVALQGLNPQSLQADKKIAEVLKNTGADIVYEGNIYRIKKTEGLKAFSYDATHTPDLFPILAILATQCEGESSIKGVHRLQYKESDRLKSISDMLEAFGAKYSVQDDELVIYGKQRLASAVIDSYNDHRIAMAAAVGATVASSTVTIRGAKAIKKSYPDFYNHLSSLGVEMQF